MMRVLGRLLRKRNGVKATKGDCSGEVIGALLKLTNPRARLSRTEVKGTVFSCLGELLWYLSGCKQLDFIEYYLKGYGKFSDDGKTIHGAYGPRLFGMRGVNQVENVIQLLRKNPGSRRAVIQLFNAEDIDGGIRFNDIPCTCNLQFQVRAGRLHLFTTMRSNDAYTGLPHDVFAFTMLQEIFARTLGLELGTYTHAVGNLHLYQSDIKKAEAFVNAGWQERISMPIMPPVDPWPQVKRLLRIESALRNRKSVDLRSARLAPYWSDLARLLMIFRCGKEKNAKAITKLKREMNSSVYNMYIAKKQKAAPTFAPEQLQLLIINSQENASDA